MYDLEHFYPVWSQVCIISIFILFLLGLIVRAIKSSTISRKEQQRVQDYNTFIAAEHEWQAGRLSEERYQSVRSWFYGRHPNGDESY